MIHNRARDAKDTRRVRERPACRVPLSLARRLHFAWSLNSRQTARGLTEQKLIYMVFSASGVRFSKLPKLFGHISDDLILLYIFNTNGPRGAKLCRYFNFYSLYKIWNDQLYRISGSQFYEWLFGTEKVSGLPSNGPQVPTTLLRKRKWSYRKLFCFSDNSPATFARPNVTMRNSEWNGDLGFDAILLLQTSF